MAFRTYYNSPSYGRNRDPTRNTTNATSERATSVTAKYINSSRSYKSSSIPVPSERTTTRAVSPISTIASRYVNYSKHENKYDTKELNKTEKPTSKYDKKDYVNKIDKPISKYEKKDYSLLSVPSVNKSRDVSPVSVSSKYGTERTSRLVSRIPELKSTKSYKDKSRDTSPVDRDKDIPNKSEKTSSYLSSYKIYPRASSYTRSSKVDSKPEITVNRYAIADPLSHNYLRSPTPVKRLSVSPVNHLEKSKSPIEKSLSPTVIIEQPRRIETPKGEKPAETLQNGSEVYENDMDPESETISVITRHTSPTPPGSSAYVRSRRADMAKTIEKTITRMKHRPEMIDKEIQSDRLDDSTRSCRFGTTARTSLSNWTYYSPSNNYTGYAGRYSTQYSNLRENSSSYSERSSRSRSTEPTPNESSENVNSNTPSEQIKHNDKPINYQPLSNSQAINVTTEPGPEIVPVFEQDKEDGTSEIFINVNFQLKKANPPAALASAEVVTPEISITNCHLPPQAPKTDSSNKAKKIKVRKSSDSASDSAGKKKTVKKRSKSVSSTDSDQTSEKSEKEKESPPKASNKKSSSSCIPNGARNNHSTSREKNSPDSSVTLSTQSSISEDETSSKSKTNDISRTSADELSIPTDRSAKQSSPQKNDTGPEEAKSFLIRALAPVTNMFKIRHQDFSDTKSWLDSTSESTGKDVSNLITESEKSKNNTENVITSNDDALVTLKSIRPIESGERAWWLESNSEKDKSSSNKNNNTNTSDNSDYNKPLKNFKLIEDEKPWWLDSSANIPEGIERLTPPRKSSSDSDKSEKFNFFKVRHIESGEKKDWWLSNSENTASNNKSESQNSLNRSGLDQKSFPLHRIRHVESGERPWWLLSDQNIPEGIEKLPTPPRQQDSDSSDSEEIQAYVPVAQVPPFPLHLPDDEPLGDRRSPEGLETPNTNTDYRGRSSPYENNCQYRHRNTNGTLKKQAYISRYTDIDDILGTSGQIYSPFMESILARQTGLAPLEDDCEEIDPTQVRIHDSTAKRPVIKKLRCRSELIDYRDEDQLDDATLQVFKDGDYGPYLDLDSTLGEQEEELEGLQDSRKNALVLRTQLSVRVHAIIERLLHSEGRELRRELFTLKQILQSDKDLVHEFVANKGLDCLMHVSAKSHQKYLDYTLRSLGQILLYVDGMHGVMNHKPCVQWLYQFIASKYRHVVKTALKLLLVFVEYTEKNSLLLIDAIQTVDSANGRLPWYNIMKILQDFDASDTELLIYATTVINRCLNNLPDRDLYYDQVDALQEQGMDDIIARYMSKQGTDLDLLRQLQIFDAVLHYEDGDESGAALKQLDESIINSVRRRSINISSQERRKSKREQMRDKAKSPVRTPSPGPEQPARRPYSPSVTDNKEIKELSTPVRRPRDRFARLAHHIIQQQEMLNSSANGILNGIMSKTNSTNGNLNITNGSYLNGNYKSNGKHSSTNGNYSNSNGSYNNTNGSHISTNGSYANTNGSYANTNGSYASTNGSNANTNGSYANTNGSYANTNGSYASTNGSNANTNGSYANTNGSYTSTNGSNANTNGSYANTNGSYANTNGSYANTNGSYANTNGSYANMSGSYASANGSYAITNGSIPSNNRSFTNSNGSFTNTNGSIIDTNGSHINGNCNNLNGNIKNDLKTHTKESFYTESTPKAGKSFNLADVIMNGNQRYTAGLKQRIQNGTLGHSVSAVDTHAVMRAKLADGPVTGGVSPVVAEPREHSIKDLAQRLTSPSSPPVADDKPLRVADMAGIVSKAKEELAKSQSKEIIKSPTIEKVTKLHEIKVSENDLHWEELKKGCLNRAYHLCDLDFSDLQYDSDDNGSPVVNASNGAPPPPPPMFLPLNAPPPLPSGFSSLPKSSIPAPPPKPTLSSELSNDSDSSTIRKNKKTVKLFWQEISEYPVPPAMRSRVGGFIWDDLPSVNLDTNMLEHLFESRTNDLIIKKLMEPKRNLILDAKRSNAINIAMKKLPTPQTIKAAIMKMDATVIGREGIEKLLSMLPTEEEKVKIQEAQYANPNLPLGSAEQFLLTLASINELSSRLKLWVFKWDFDNLEKEIAEPLMDLKQGIELLKANKTFKVILSTLRSVGCFLNGSQVKGFKLEYLSKVMEVKDTVHKHPLLYHICEMIIEKFPDTTDFFSEVGAVIRASKVDFDMLSANLLKLEADCKASWDHMKRVVKHDGLQIFKTKINEFLTDAAERIILLTIIKRRVMNRYDKFLLYVGVPPSEVSKTKPSDLLKVIAEFALEYRTTRERVLQQLEKKANHRERNKTRGKMIIDVGNYASKNGDSTADHALKALLKTVSDTDSITDRRRQRLNDNTRTLINGDVSADDEIIESLVRSATSRRRPAPRERRRNRLGDKRSLNRTLEHNGQS